MENKPWVNASEIGQAKFCPHSLFLQKRGYKPNREASIAMRRGSRAHARKAADAQLAEDKRCYIATAIYGAEHPMTQMLRQWRDEQLTPYWWGRLITWSYYKLSPVLVKLAGDNHLARGCIDQAIRRLLGVKEHG